MSRSLQILLSLACVVLTACAQDNGQSDNSNAPQTGNEVLENEIAPITEQPMATEGQVSRSKSEDVFYVYATQLRVRSSVEILADLSNVVGMLNINDELKVLGATAANGMVQVQILKTNAQIKEAAAYFVSAQHLSKNKQDQRIISDKSLRYFMVQNIATEKLRIYEKMCDDGSCAHKMIFETNIAVGEKKKGKEDLMTIAGNFHLSKWTKFYQDGAALYPSWYDPALPMPPGPGKGVMDWRSKKVMPNGGDARGAFGWYTAFPAGGKTNAQWTHGTLGWGQDKDKYIKVTRSFWANLFTDPRSHGCSRTDNESIAYIRYMLPVKTPMIKIYAKEAYADDSLSNYTKDEGKTWDYILTKRGVRVDGEVADRETVLRNGTPKSDWIEEGTYKVDTYPSAKGFKGEGGRGARNGSNGNVYGLKDHQMQGVFMVDAGLVWEYKTPAAIIQGGYTEKQVPDFMRSKSSTYTLAPR